GFGRRSRLPVHQPFTVHPYQETSRWVDGRPGATGQRGRGPDGGDARDRGGRRVAARFLLVCCDDQSPTTVGRCRGSVAGPGRREGGAGEPYGDPVPAERR